MRAPRNTARQDPMDILGAAVLFKNPIEREEALGQYEFVESDTLPAEISAAWTGGHRLSPDEVKSILESWGIKFLGPVEDDDQFVFVELPEGWTRRATEHSMWSNLLDEKGRVRAKMFYKAAFYDRHAMLHIEHFFRIEKEWKLADSSNLIVYDVLQADGDVVFHTDPVSFDPKDPNRYKLDDVARDAAVAWLTEKYPNWGDPAAYWD